MTLFQMYLLILLTKLPEFGEGLGILGIIVFLLSGLLYCVAVSEGEKESPTGILTKKVLVGSFCIAVLGFGMSFFGVDFKQLAIIYGVPAVVNNEQAQKLPNNVLNVVNTWLEDQVKEDK